MDTFASVHESLIKKVPTLDNEGIKKAILHKYYDDAIILEDNTVINFGEYDIKEVQPSEFSMDLPKKNNIYYFNEKFKNKYFFLKGSKQRIEKSYLDQLIIYDVELSFKSTEDIYVSYFIVEYHGSEIIDILESETTNISFQPNEKTNGFEVLLKLEGEGLIYNLEVFHKSRKREILASREIFFNEDQFFVNGNLVNISEYENQLLLNINPNDKKHIYMSYKEKNNKFTLPPTENIMAGIDLSSNLLIELNLLKDETIEMIPMIIEYGGEIKNGIKNIDIHNPEVIKLKKETDNVRLAFRLSGAGQIKLHSLNVLSLEDLPKNKRLDFGDRNDVVKLLSPSLKLNDFKVACIMDEFTYNSFSPEVQMHKLDMNKWKSELLFIQPDLVFIESAWVGNDGTWHRKVAYYDDEQHKDIRELIIYSQSLNIPVVFWNKEDPVHYDRFIETAKLCDCVFTTDKGRVNQYKNDCGHNEVYSLPFAAQPKNHNPIKIQKHRDPRVSFAGSYYRHHEERSKDMDILLEASKEIGLVIYDRNYEKTKKGQMPNHKFPERFEPYIQGSLPFNLIDKSYKGYKYMINVNTVKHSETMFSRRVFEGLLSGTPIISTYSLGMKKMFGDIIDASSEIEDLREHLRKLDHNQELYNKYALRGIREVLQNHTYEQRMKKILYNVGYNVLSNKINVHFFCFIEDDFEIQDYINIFNSQSVKNKKLILVHKNISDYKFFYNTYNTEEIVGIDFNVLKKYTNIRQLTDEGYIVVLDKNHFYAENYALDLILAREYSQADIIGKSMYYSLENGELIIKNDSEDYIYTSSLKVDQSIINVKVFDKFSVESSLDYLMGNFELKDLVPFGAKLFSNDSLNFIEFGREYDNKNRVEI